MSSLLLSLHDSTNFIKFFRHGHKYEKVNKKIETLRRLENGKMQQKHAIHGNIIPVHDRPKQVKQKDYLVDAVVIIMQSLLLLPVPKL